jgi:hypothetical protein
MKAGLVALTSIWQTSALPLRRPFRVIDPESPVSKVRTVKGARKEVLGIETAESPLTLLDESVM